jgi:hypothetical protein
VKIILYGKVVEKHILVKNVVNLMKAGPKIIENIVLLIARSSLKVKTIILGNQILNLGLHTVQDGINKEGKLVNVMDVVKSVLYPRGLIGAYTVEQWMFIISFHLKTSMTPKKRIDCQI